MRKFYGRHGKAGAAAQGQKDVDRELNEVGIGQAIARGKKMNGTKFGLVISSPAPRAGKTAAIVTSKSKDEIVFVDVLYPPPDDGDVGTRLDVLFNKLGYKPVSDYLKEADGKVVTQWSEQAHAECQEVIERAGYPDVVGIFGHAVCSQALAIQDCIDYPEFVQQIADINLGECDMILVTFDNRHRPVSVEHIRD